MNNHQNRTNDNRIAPGQEWQIDLFRPDDAAGVADLFRAVYGADYPIRTYIEPELLKKENAARRVISSVARTLNGDIVGHNALFQSAPYKKIYESGAGLVHKDYRGGHGIFTEMIAHGIRVGHQDFGVELVYGEAVCNHIFSQKACYNLGLMTRAIEVDLMPAAAYSQEKSASGRVSTMLCFKTLTTRPHTVFLPPIYDKQINFLYADLDDSRTLKLADKNLGKDVKTQLKTEIFSFANVARITISETGSDLSLILNHEENRLQKTGIKVLQAWLNLGSPSAGNAVAIMRQSGYFFGGILPRWFNNDGLLMQKIIADPNWDEMHIHYDNDRKLIDMVRADWQRAKGL